MQAKEQLDLLIWSANKLASENSPQAAMIKSKAEQAVAHYHALLQNQPAPAAPAPVPVSAAPAPVPVSAAPAAATAPAVDLGEVLPLPASASAEVKKAKEQVDLLVWSANQLAFENSPQAAMMKSKADQAVATYHALLQNQPAPGASTQPVSAAPAPEPVSAAPAPAIAPAPVVDGVLPLPADASAEVKKAKEQVDLLVWSASKLASENSPQAAMMKSKAEQAVAQYHALLQNQPAPMASAMQPVS